MKKVVVLCVLVGVAVYAATAWSAPSSTDPTVSRLVKDVATLKKQVSTLQKQQKTLTKDLNTIGDIAVTDDFQGTWQVIDQISTVLQGGKTYFGPQTSPVTATIQGQDICSGFNVTRSPATTGLAPTIAQYQALLAPFHTSSDRFRATVLSLFAGLHLK
jgi:hypothetical protein